MADPKRDNEEERCESCGGTGRRLRGQVECFVCEGDGLAVPLTIGDLARRLGIRGLVERGPIRRAAYLARGRFRSQPFFAKRLRIRD